METLGSLCDKLIVTELKMYHTVNISATTLMAQRERLHNEIDQFVVKATVGKILPEDLVFDSNKVYDTKISLPQFSGSIGSLVSDLCSINCVLWHEIDKSYSTENCTREELATLVNNLAVLNLQRNKCIDAIDKQFKGQVML